MSDIRLKRAVIRAARRANPSDPKAELNTRLDKLYADVAAGKAIVASQEGGGSINWAILGGMSPNAAVALLEDALTWLEAQTPADVTDPTKLPRAIYRLRASFDQAAI